MKEEIICYSCPEKIKIYCAGSLSDRKGIAGFACKQEYPVILNPRWLQLILPDITADSISVEPR